MHSKFSKLCSLRCFELLSHSVAFYLSGRYRFWGGGVGWVERCAAFALVKKKVEQSCQCIMVNEDFTVACLLGRDVVRKGFNGCS